MSKTEKFSSIISQLGLTYFTAAIAAIEKWGENQSTDFSESPDIKEAYLNLNMHILSGEFMQWQIDLLKSEEMIELTLERLQNILATSSSPPEKKREVALEFAYVIALIRKIVSEVDSDLKKEISFSRQGYHSNYNNQNILPLSRVFSINIELAGIDFFFMSFRSLEGILMQLDRLGIELDFCKNQVTQSVESKSEINVIDATIEKKAFLFNKILLAQSESINSDGSNLSSRLHAKANYQLRYLQKYMDTAFNHYTKNTIGILSLSKKQIYNIENKIALRTLNEYHKAIVYYRYHADIKDAILHLQKIETVFKTKYDYRIQGLSEYDKQARKTAHSFLASVVFELQLGMTDCLDLDGFEKALELMKARIEKNEEIFFPNTDVEAISFYDYRIFSKYCEKYCKKNASESKLDSIALIKILQEWNIVNGKWKIAIEKALLDNIHPFFLPFDESLFDLKQDNNKANLTGMNNEAAISEASMMFGANEIKLFIASSYIFPINIEAIKQELSKISIGLNEYQYLLIQKARNEIEAKVTIKTAEIARSAAQDTAKDAAERTAFKTAREISKDSELRAIQVIAVFVSVVAFAGTSLGVAKLELNAAHAALFLGIIGFVLTMFVCLIIFHLKRMNQEDRKSLDEFMSLPDNQQLKEVISHYENVKNSASGNSGAHGQSTGTGSGNEPEPPKPLSVLIRLLSRIGLMGFMFLFYLILIVAGAFWVEYLEDKKEKSTQKKCGNDHISPESKCVMVPFPFHYPSCSPLPDYCKCTGKPDSPVKSPPVKPACKSRSTGPAAIFNCIATITVQPVAGKSNDTKHTKKDTIR